jgi:hypothetical protein
MTDKNKTYIGVILDRSGSMTTIKSDMTGGFNTFIKAQKKVEGEAVVSLFQFDSDFETVYKNKPISEVPHLNLIPRGSTALRDAVGKASAIIGEDLAALPEDERPGNVVILVISDGLENASREFTGPDIQKIIKEQTDKYNWNYQYLGANQDAVTAGTNLGFAAANTLTYGTSQDSVINTWNNLSSSVTRGRKASVSGLAATDVAVAYAYTPQERASSNVDDSDATE